MNSCSNPGAGRAGRPSFVRIGALVASALLFASACGPEIPSATCGDAHAPASIDAEGAIPLSIEPPSLIDQAPPILRARLSFPGVESADLARVFVIEGEVGPAHLRQIEKGSLSKALSERVVPSVAWLDEGASATSLLVAPLMALELGQTYAVALGDPPLAVHLHVAAEDSAPRLDRIWPPLDSAATLGFGVWCGADPLPPFTTATNLEPAGIFGSLRSGAIDGAGANCLRFEADPASNPATMSAGLAGPLVGLPAVDLAGTVTRLDPRPFLIDAPPADVAPLACEPDEEPFGLGCARIEDDRLFGRAPDAPLLWTVHGAGLDAVFATGNGDPFILVGLPPETSVYLDVSNVDIAGTLLRNVVASTTLAPMAHIVINEVLANPLGPEPAQEWVELVNDGLVTADLSGYKLIDIGGVTELPKAELAPGGHAIIVSELFAEDDELDPIPAPNTLILRVPKLGKGGLSNSGEPLKLTDASGRAVSRFPVGPRVKPGWSVARTKPSAPDGLASSFRPAEPTPGAQNEL